MRKHSRGLLVLIIVITLLAVFINIPPQIVVNYDSPKLPLINKQISIHKEFHGFYPNFFLGPIHIQKDLSFKEGLDLQGGTSLTLKADMKDVPEAQRQQALDSAKEVIEKRVNFFGVSEPVVQTAQAGQNDYRIIVEIPGVTDLNQAVSLIGQTAKLTFWEGGAASGSAEASASALPVGITQILGPNPKKTNLTGADLEQSSVTFDQSTGKPQVQLVFTSKGAKKFGDITKRNVGKVVAIALDNQVIEAPNVSEAIYGGNAVITGGFTTDQAKTLAIQLNAGALPISLSILQQQAIGATLGAQSLQRSLTAGLLGFVVIVIFMIVLYGRLGVIASIALTIYTLIVLSLFRLIPVTLTLAGIAGFILSIGIAVDANILIFERMKEELRHGKPRETAMELGFSRAWPSIRDSNISSLITSSILYIFGTSIIRGFALTLAIGVVVSLFSAITITQTLLKVFIKNE